jgi:hypothetical protein
MAASCVRACSGGAHDAMTRQPAGGEGTPIARVDLAQAREQNVDPPAAS